MSDLKIAEKTDEKFVKEYLSNELFFYNATDATKIPLREKPIKVEKEKPKPKKRGQPKKGEIREPILWEFNYLYIFKDAYFIFI